MSGSFVVTTNPRACAVLQDLPGSTRKRKITSKMIRPSTRVDITWDCMETVLMNELAFATLDGVPSQFHAQWWIYEYVTNMRNHAIIKSSVCRSGGFSGFHTISNWMRGDVRVAQGPLLGLIFRGDLAGKMVHWVANPLRLSGQWLTMQWPCWLWYFSEILQKWSDEFRWRISCIFLKCEQAKGGPTRGQLRDHSWSVFREHWTAQVYARATSHS